MSYACSYCYKDYSSLQSRCNHIRNFHKDESKPKSKPVILIEKDNELEKNFPCRKCNKIFKFKQSRWKHEKKCKENNLLDLQKIIKN